ncbi:MAG TPA: alkaline phosphatase family protein [Actinomycetes bacterium]|nr:alkaline phosphatase family protein [Actinomycetes bacterium]
MGGNASAAPPLEPDDSAPTKVLIVLFDQMRPEYADRFDMPNFRALRDAGTNFNEAYLGYMGSETVIAHNVIMSGQSPKNMGWVDEAYRDREGLLSQNKDQMWITGELTYDQYGTIIQNKGYPKLADYLQEAQPDKKFIVVGEKGYAVDSSAAESAWDTSDADIHVRFSGRSSSTPTPGTPDAECNATLGGRYRFPEGRNVPSYLTEFCGRYYVQSADTYGTSVAFPSWIYPLDGNRFVPGFDDDHLGGDNWVADAAMDMMENEDWSGMFVTLGGIDKAGHMWGAQSDRQSVPGSPDFQTHVKFNAENADLQLGRMLDKLEELGELDDTLVVLTADHGATFGEEYYGKTAPGVSTTSDTNWYYGPTSLPSQYNNPSPSLSPMINTGNIAFSYQSTSIQAWLKDASNPARKQVLKAMDKLPGVIATYWRKGGKFNQFDKNPIPPDERAWFKANAQSIVNTMADVNGPDAVALLRDKVSYGAYGDHGGVTESVQRVPMVFWSADQAYANNTSATFHTPDVMPTILRALGLEQTYPTDGQARALD